MSTTDTISIVIPVYNSEDVLEELAQQMAFALGEAPYELILVNDQSKDNSWNVIKSLTAKDKRLKGVNLRKNSGQDNAIMAGLGQAKGDWMVIMDDDLQHSPHDIPVLIEEAKSKEADICYADFRRKKQALWKNMGSWFNGKISEFALGKPRDIYLSPFKVFRGEMVKDILSYNGTYPYLDGILFQITANIVQIPVEHHERYAGRSNYNLFKSIGVFLKMLTGFSIYPLRLASYMGFFITVLGLLSGVYYLVEYLTGDRTYEGWATLVMLILIIGGAVLTTLGIMGEYLGRLYLGRNFPRQYIIKEVVNNDTL